MEKHDYGFSKRCAVYNFFAHHLGLSVGRVPFGSTFEEDFVTVLPRGALSVFDAEHPLPTGCLEGDEAVMKYLGIGPGHSGNE